MNRFKIGWTGVILLLFLYCIIIMFLILHNMSICLHDSVPKTALVFYASMNHFILIVSSLCLILVPQLKQRLPQ